jgi:hypothetical protein
VFPFLKIDNSAIIKNIIPTIKNNSFPLKAMINEAIANTVIETLEFLHKELRIPDLGRFFPSIINSVILDCMFSMASSPWRFKI